jgi:hypothetical protein
MATVAPMQPAVSPTDPAWVPSPLYRMSLEQYEAIIAAGAFTKRDRVQLKNGYLVEKLTELPPHGAACDATDLMLGPLIPAGWYARIERVLKIPGYASMPEPDLVIVRGTWRDYASRYPEPADTAMIVEVANSSLHEDRAMAAISGAAGIPVSWIVNLVNRQVEVHTNPGPAGSASRQDFAAGQQVPVVIGGRQVGMIAVDDILP